MHYKKLSFPYFFFFLLCPQENSSNQLSSPGKNYRGHMLLDNQTKNSQNSQNSQKNPFPTHQLAPTGCCAVSNSSTLPLTYGYCQLKFQPKPIEW